MSELEKRKRDEYQRNRQKWIIVEIFVAVLLVLAALLTFIPYKMLNNSTYVYYAEDGKADTKVYLADNSFYTEEYLDSNHAYIAELIKTIDTDFKYALAMDATEVEYKYSYKIDATLNIIDRESKAPLYDPNFVLKEVNDSVSSNNELYINEKISIDYAYYDNMAKEFVNEYDINDATAKLVVRMNVQVLGKSETLVEDKANSYSMEVSIPLLRQTLKLTTQSSVPTGEQKILACDTAAKTVLLVLWIVFLCLALLVIAFTIAFVILTRDKHIDYSRRVQKLLSNYKSYIHRIKNQLDFSSYKVLNVMTFEELLEIGDKLQNPVLMYENEDKTASNFFITTDSGIVYLYTVKVIDDEDELDDRDDYAVEYTPEPVAAESAEEAVEETAEETAQVTEEAVIEEAPAEEAVAEEAVTEEAPAEEAVTEETPAEDAVTEETLAEEAVIEEAPAEEAVTEETPAEEAVTEETPAEEAVIEEAPTEEAVIEEAPVEEAVIEETPAEEAVIEETPAEEAVIEEAPVEEAIPEPVAEKAAEAEEVDTVVIVPVESDENDESSDTPADFILSGALTDVRLRRSFMSRYIQSDSEVQNYYTTIKNRLLSYKGVKARTSWRAETFKKGRVHIAKVDIKGKKLYLYLALDPKDFENTKYFFTDMSAKDENLPMLFKIRSERAEKHAVELIDALAERLELVRTNRKDEDYTMPYESDEVLIAKGLLKVLSGNVEVMTASSETAEVAEVAEVAETAAEPVLDEAPEVVVDTAGEPVAEQAEAAPAEEAAEETSEACKAPVDEIVVELVEEAVAEEAVEEPKAVEETVETVEAIDVKWEHNDKYTYRYDPNGETVDEGDIVIVPTKIDNVVEVEREAEVARGNYNIPKSELKKPLKKIISVIRRKMQNMVASSDEPKK